MVRSVLEGVACNQRQGLELARGAGAIRHSPVWRQVLADGLGIGIRTTTAATGAVRGAAVPAGLGIGLYASPEVGIACAEQRVEAPQPLDAGFERSRGCPSGCTRPSRRTSPSWL
jgi:sugar (pentulose or hexulose) kinase